MRRFAKHMRLSWTIEKLAYVLLCGASENIIVKFGIIMICNFSFRVFLKIKIVTSRIIRALKYIIVS